MKKLALTIGMMSAALVACAVSHKDFGRLVDGRITSAPCALRVGDAIVGEAMLTAADYAAAGWLAIDRSLPDAPEGKVVTPTGWTDEGGTIKRTYTITDAPEPVKVPRKFSKLKIYAAITKLGAWEKIQAWLEAKQVDGVNGWIAFQLAQEVSEDNELFAAWAEEARQLLGLDETTFNAFLDGCILEEN